MEKEDKKALSTQEYWDSRYAGGGEYEWYRSFEDLRTFLQKHLPSRAVPQRILHLGCGTSEIPQRLFDLGYISQCCVDFSSTAINSMRERCEGLNGLEWKTMDVRNMAFKDQSFETAIDKGTLDAIFWGSPLEPEDEVKKNVEAYIKEVARCLKPGGRWLCVTSTQPRFLCPLLQTDGIWNVTVENLGGFKDGPLMYFGWVLEKIEKS